MKKEFRIIKETGIIGVDKLFARVIIWGDSKLVDLCESTLRKMATEEKLEVR